MDAPRRELYDAITGGPRAAGPQAFPLVDDDGALTGPFNAMLLNPAVGQALQALGAACRYGTNLTGRCRELVILVVAHQLHSAFEIEAHEAVGALLGLTPGDLELVRSGRLDDLSDATERLAAVTARVLLERADLDDTEYAAAVTSFGEAGVFEITTIVGYYSTLALQLRVFRA